MIAIEWEVEGYSGTTCCEWYDEEREVAALKRAGYTIIRTYAL